MKPSSYYMLCAGTAWIFALSACGGAPIETEAKYPTGADRASTNGDIYAKPQGIFGSGGLLGKKKDGDQAGQSGIGVNSFLWRASLDTVSFMPLASADPFGGVILTDWYMPDTAKGERYKINVFILGKQLRSDGVTVRVFKQVGGKNGWKDVATPTAMQRQLEDAILTRARQLRLAQSEQG